MTPTRNSPLLVLFCFAALCYAEPPRFVGISDATVKARGPHQRTLERVSTYVTSYGREVYRTNTIEEIGTGICYWDAEANTWKDTEELIEIFPAGGVARKGPHQLIISPDLLGESPAIDISTSDGKRLQCRLWGVVYRDAVTGNNVLIAEPNPEAVAVLVPPNRIVWQHALLDFDADLQVTYTRAGVECELIARERFDGPEAWNLSEETRLTVWTEWFDAPEPRKEVQVIRQETDPQVRQAMAEPDVVDETLIFGAMRLTQGTAFRLGQENDSILVRKQWVNVDGRVFLVESVDYNEVKPLVDGLPVAANGNAANRALARNARKAATATELVQLASRVEARAPDARNSFADRKSKVLQSASLQQSNAPSLRASLPAAMQLASKEAYARRPGFSIDWTLLSGQSNFVFQCDTTYKIDSDAIFTGTTVIEGGCVVKFTDHSANPDLFFNGPIDCRTTRTRPAIFTAWPDHSVGDMVGSITNTITTNIYANLAIRLNSSGTVFDLHDIHVRYACPNGQFMRPA